MNIQKRRETHLTKNGQKKWQAFHRKSSVIAISHKDVFVFKIPAGHRAGFS